MPAFFAKHVRFLASLCASLVLLTSLSTLSHAQQPAQDFEAPSMEHDPLEFSASDPIQPFTATVADNTDLKSVRLFYRYEGEEEFRVEDMNSIADSPFYTARISVSEGTSSTIEYYIQAEDEAGNVVLKGYAFAPLERVLSPTAAAELTAEPKASVATGKPKSKVLYYVLGALAVGTLAALAGGGSDDSTADSGNSCGDAGCLVTFTVGTP